MSSAPHIAQASEHIGRVVLFSRADPLVEVGLRSVMSGPLRFSADELWFCLRGSATFGHDTIQNGDVIHFKEGWIGAAQGHGAVVASYMRCRGGPRHRTPVLRQALTAGPPAEWGPVSTMIEGQS